MDNYYDLINYLNQAGYSNVSGIQDRGNGYYTGMIDGQQKQMYYAPSDSGSYQWARNPSQEGWTNPYVTREVGDAQSFTTNSPVLIGEQNASPLDLKTYSDSGFEKLMDTVAPLVPLMFMGAMNPGLLGLGSGGYTGTSAELAADGLGGVDMGAGGLLDAGYTGTASELAADGLGGVDMTGATQAGAPVADASMSWVSPGTTANLNGVNYLGLPGGTPLSLGAGTVGSSLLDSLPSIPPGASSLLGQVAGSLLGAALAPSPQRSSGTANNVGPGYAAYNPARFTPTYRR